MDAGQLVFARFGPRRSLRREFLGQDDWRVVLDTQVPPA